jgi:integrase
MLSWSEAIWISFSQTVRGIPRAIVICFSVGSIQPLRRAKLRKIRFHDLRHTFCSLLIKNREDPRPIQRLMGHSSIRITFDIYGHLFPDKGGDVASRLEGLIWVVAKWQQTQKRDRSLYQFDHRK